MAGLFVVVLATPAASQTAMPIRGAAPISLRAVAGSGVQGRASLGVEEGHEPATILTVDLQGLIPSEAYAVQVRGGRPDAASVGFGTLGLIQANDFGQAHLQTDTLTASAGGDALPFSLDLLGDGDHFVEIRVGTGEVVAVGEISGRNSAEGGARMSQPLTFIGGAGTGQITVSSAMDTAFVAIQADRLRPNSRYVAHLHSGTPQTPTASVGPLGYADTDGSGHLQLLATDAVISAGAQVPLSNETLFDGEHFVDLHNTAGTLIATARLPRMATAGLEDVLRP